MGVPPFGRIARSFGGGLVLLAFWGCGSAQRPQPVVEVPAAPPKKAAAEVPEWVVKMPRKNGYICATGAVDPTFYRQDGRVHAAEAARGELAKSIEVQVTSVMYDEQSSAHGRDIDQAVVTQVVGSITEGVLSGSEVLAYWFDDVGTVSRVGMTYALACMSTSQSVAQLADKLKEAYQGEDREAQVARVRDRAQAAFDELEAMEARGGQAAVPGPGQ